MAEADTRIVSLDHKLLDRRVENTTFAATKTLLEHEIAIWNPNELPGSYSTETFRGSPCLNEDKSAAFARSRARREREIVDLLQLGRLLVVLVPSPKEFWVSTGKTNNLGTAAKPRLETIVDRVLVKELIPLQPQLREASGSRFELVANEPFASFWRSVGEQFHYLAYMEADVTPLLKIKGADRIVASLGSLDKGTLLFLPQRYQWEPECEQKDDEPDEDYWERYDQEADELTHEMDGAFVDALLELARGIGASSVEELPEWSNRIVIPGEERASKRAKTAENKAAVAIEAADAARVALISVRERKRLITETGKALEQAVESALVELGCNVNAGAPFRTDKVIEWQGRKAVVEVKGTAKSATEGNAAQLEKWVSEYTIEHDEVPKGILIVNAWRGLPLDERQEATFPSQMIPFARNRGHCLMTTAQLLTALLTATSQKKRAEFLSAVFDAKGPLKGWAWEDVFEVHPGGDEKGKRES